MILLNPTGGNIRNDSEGFGFFHAPRGAKLHKGVDFTLPGKPGQPVYASITGKFKRIAYPYADTRAYGGGLFENGDIAIMLFYFRPDLSLLKQEVTMGQVIGVAQDVSKRYPNMTPHVHLQVEWINPLILMGDKKWTIKT